MDGVVPLRTNSTLRPLRFLEPSRQCVSALFLLVFPGQATNAVTLNATLGGGGQTMVFLVARSSQSLSRADGTHMASWMIHALIGSRELVEVDEDGEHQQEHKDERLTGVWLFLFG